jgi:4-amino-4-deoxy-L-arabinose transferase-like glycosyltransferase
MLMTKPDNLTKWLIFIGAISFLPTLFFYLTGEEGIYIITSMEMWHQGNWVQQIMYGTDNQRPPLVNWLIMPVANLIGWAHVVIAARSVSIAATLGMIAWLYWLSLKLFADKSFALFAALAGLSLADLLIYRGWLTYTDPVFAFFTFGAMATLWVAAIERHRGWLLVSVLLVSCAMLSKAFTAYIFYGTTALVLLWQRQHRGFLLSPMSVMIFALAFIVPVAWFASIPQIGGHSATMFDEITRKLRIEDWAGYVGRLLAYPIEIAIRLSPAALLACYLLLRKRTLKPEAAPDRFQTASFITVLCILPYWLAPQGGIRYILPIYPFAALVAARIIWRAGDTAKITALRWFAAMIAFKLVFALILFPYYQTHYRGENYTKAGRDIMELTGGHPLYVTDVSSSGLCVTGFIDIQRFPLPPIVYPPPQWQTGFLISRINDPSIGKLVRHYKLAADDLFLLCRGEACAVTGQ